MSSREKVHLNFLASQRQGLPLWRIFVTLQSMTDIGLAGRGEVMKRRRIAEGIAFLLVDGRRPRLDLSIGARIDPKQRIPRNVTDLRRQAYH